jgi:hypothetical protein
MTENITTVDSNVKMERLSMKQRNAVQLKVFEKIGILDDMDAILDCRKSISDYIDNVDNKEVRNLMMLDTITGYEQAADIIISKVDLGRKAKAA